YKNDFQFWRDKVEENTLRIGSITSAASQLPLTLMRKISLVERFAAEPGKKLDPASIGLISGDQVKWNIFYDADDILGFATRRLYDDQHDLIRDRQVNAGATPLSHSGYWKNRTVQKMTAQLIFDNLD
ncbi:MAG: hypothetical protein N2D54_12305, partial [Chloroflexota bacterium]